MFELLDHAAVSDEALDQFEFNTFLGKDNHKGLQTTVVGAGKPQKQQQQQLRASFEEEAMKRPKTKGAGAKGFGAKK